MSSNKTFRRKHKIVPEGNRCSATCLSGEQCSKSRLLESDYCKMHDKIKDPYKYQNPYKTEKLKEDAMIKRMTEREQNVQVKTGCIGDNCSIMGGRRYTKRSYKKSKKRTYKR